MKTKQQRIEELEGVLAIEIATVKQLKEDIYGLEVKIRSLESDKTNLGLDKERLERDKTYLTVNLDKVIEIIATKASQKSKIEVLEGLFEDRVEQINSRRNHRHGPRNYLG